ncbi:ShlB/FhaC/HecB family hemolysin secretion/activation protein, partial [Cupriavidus pampae]
NGRLAMVQGLNLLGSLHDPSDLPRDLPHAQFNKFTLDLGYNRRFELAGTPLTFSTQLSGQAANDTLYGTQQILIGGPSSVRGFQNYTLAGDNGYFVRNELGLPWQVSTAMLGNPTGTLAGRVYAGFDWGNVTNRAAGVPSGSLSGATLGIGLFWKTVAIDAFAARAVRAPSSQFREGTLFSLRLSASI